MLEWKNAKINIFGTYDVEVNHPRHGWILFTASPEDDEKTGRDLHEEIMNSGEAAEYAEPAPVNLTVGAIIANADFLLGATDWILDPFSSVSQGEREEIELFRRDVRATSHTPRPLEDLNFPTLEERFKRQGR